ncbi:hypothetical protein O2K51_14565 [Apibacter raozihei]|uniref:hypothetical protein n=1 Tax=Apibacter raozihei TaxID=2500547 RepID=UPI000FE3E415|nr:hypothetical protein [Apibacter raozihei]
MMKKLYDIYLKKALDKDPLILNENNNINWWKNKGFIGLNLDLEKIKDLKKIFIQNKIQILIVPINYRDNKSISYEDAQRIANENFLKTKIKLGENRFGEIKDGVESPIWYPFLADDYVLQEEGYTPGYWGCYVDKLSGKILDKKTIMFYEFL